MEKSPIHDVKWQQVSVEYVQDDTVYINVTNEK